MKPYPAYKDSGIEWIGKIPDGWKETYLKYAVNEIIGGGTPDTKNIDFWATSGGIPWVAISDISESQGTLKSTTKSITEDGRKSKNLSIIPKGTMLISIFASLGKTTMLEIDATVNQAILGIIPSLNLEKKFLKYFFIDVERNIGYYSSSNTQENLNLTKIKELPLPLPPLPEQQAIASFLDNKTHLIDEAISKKEQLIKLLEEERAAKINHAVTKGLNPNVKMKDSGVEWIGEIPDGWEVKRLKYISQVQPSNVDKKSQEGEEKVKLCNYVEVYKYEFIDSTISFMEATAKKDQIDKFELKKNDIIITKDSEDYEDICVPTLVIQDLPLVLCGYHLTHIRAENKILNGAYLFRLFQSKQFNTQFVVAANGITRYGVSTYPIANCKISLPPLPEQQAIVDYLNQETQKIDKTIKKIKAEIELLQEYRTSLISEAVTGKIDVREVA